MFIRLESLEGRGLLFNSDYIVCILGRDNGAVVVTVDDRSFDVIEPVDDVYNLLNDRHLSINADDIVNFV